MNLLPKIQIENQPPKINKTNVEVTIPTTTTVFSGDVASGLDLSFLIQKTDQTKPKLTSESSTNGDDCMVDITEDFETKTEEKSKSRSNSVETKTDEKSQIVPVEKEEPKQKVKVEIKPLTDLSVTIESVKPSSIPPLTVLEEKNGISVVLHFAKDKPRDDVHVIVVTTLSKNTSALSNYHFQAVVPKVSHLLFLLIVIINK